MAGGAGGGGLGFGVGFARGFGNALLSKRERDREAADKAQAARDKEFQTLLPVLLQMGAESGDFAGVEQFIRQHHPDVDKGTKKGQSPLSRLGDWLKPLVGMQRSGGQQRQLPTAMPPANQPPGVTGGTLGSTPVYSAASGVPTVFDRPPAETHFPPAVEMPPGEAPFGMLSGDHIVPPSFPNPVAQPDAQPAATAPAAQSPTAVVMSQAGPPQSAAPAAGSTFMGVHVLTPDERITHDIEQTKHIVERARSILLPTLQTLDPTATLDDALSIIKTGLMAKDQRAAGTSSASLFADQLKAREAELGRPLTADERLTERQKWEAQNDAQRSIGTWAELALTKLGITREEAVRTGRMDEVTQLAQQLAAGQAGSTTAARVGEQAKAPMTPQQRFDNTLKLQDDWRKAEEPRREMERQYQLMTTGLSRYKAGDRIGGSQAVLVTFQKILDPRSVVRESEYARSSQGLPIRERIKGMYERYLGQYDPDAQKWVGGGAGVPEAELAMMVETARQFLDGMSTWNDLERERITSTAKEFGLNPDRVFGVAAAADKKTGGGAGGSATTPASGQPGQPGQPYQDATGKWVIP